jgi:hypothetical protein
VGFKENQGAWMSQLSKKFRSIAGGKIGYWCQGCDMLHMVRVGAGVGPKWNWNGDLEKPTFTPSVLVTWEQGEPPATTPEIREKIRSGEITQVKVPKICHTFITNGMVQFLGDCTHQYAGRTLPLPDLPPEWIDEEATP